MLNISPYVSASSVDKVPAYWASIKLRRILQPELKRIAEEVKALNLTEVEKARLITERVNKLTKDYIHEHSTLLGDGKIELRIDED